MVKGRTDEVVVLDLGVDGKHAELRDSDYALLSAISVGKDGLLQRAATYDKQEEFDGYHIQWDKDEKLASIRSFSHGKQEGKTYLFDKGDVVQVDYYSRGEKVSSENSRIVLAKARTKEIPNIVDSVLHPYEKTLKEIKQKSHINAEKERSGVVVNDQAIEAGVSLKKPVDTKTLQGMIADKVLDDFMNS